MGNNVEVGNEETAGVGGTDRAGHSEGRRGTQEEGQGGHGSAAGQREAEGQWHQGPHSGGPLPGAAPVMGGVLAAPQSTDFSVTHTPRATTNLSKTPSLLSRDQKLRQA